MGSKGPKLSSCTCHFVGFVMRWLNYVYMCIPVIIQDSMWSEMVSTLHYANISVHIKPCRISVIPSYIWSILLMNIIYKLLILHNRKLNRHNKYYTFQHRNIEKKAIIMLINTYPRFPPFLLYFRCKLGVTFARRCFHDDWIGATPKSTQMDTNTFRIETTSHGNYDKIV